MPPRGWKKGADGTYYKITEGLIEKSGVAPPDKTSGSEVNRLKQLLKAIPDAPFVQMASNSMEREQARELCELFRKLKA